MGDLMVKVEFSGPIDREPLELNISSLKELAEYLEKDEKVKNWLEESAIAVNDKIVKDISFQLKSGDKVSLLPPVCGG